MELTTFYFWIQDLNYALVNNMNDLPDGMQDTTSENAEIAFLSQAVAQYPVSSVSYRELQGEVFRSVLKLFL